MFREENEFRGGPSGRSNDVSIGIELNPSEQEFGPRAEIINAVVQDPDIIRICENLAALINSSFTSGDITLLTGYVRRSNEELTSLILHNKKNNLTPRDKFPPLFFVGDESMKTSNIPERNNQLMATRAEWNGEMNEFGALVPSARGPMSDGITKDNLLKFVKFYVRTIVTADNRANKIKVLKQNIKQITDGLTAINNNDFRVTPTLEKSIPQDGMGIYHLQNIFLIMKQSHIIGTNPSKIKEFFELLLNLYTRIQQLLVDNGIQGGNLKKTKKRNIIKKRRTIKNKKSRKHRKFYKK
jgi:hypothetical protein